MGIVFVYGHGLSKPQLFMNATSDVDQKTGLLEIFKDEPQPDGSIVRRKIASFPAGTWTDVREDADLDRR
jgi:hypothetical protein